VFINWTAIQYLEAC